MAVPVQTWGTMGNLVAEQKEFGLTTAEYLERYEVYDLFAHLLEQVVLAQPEKPLKFLQDQLKSKAKLYIAVMSPPSVSRTHQCQRLASEFKIKHIHIGKILRGRRELREQLEAGELIDDNVVIDVVKHEIQGARGTGWVLDGFPRTKVQAQFLASKEAGVCVENVLLLTTSDAEIRENFAQKVIASGLLPGEGDDIINRRIQQYHRHTASIAEIFRNIIRHVSVQSGDEGQSLTYNAIRSNLHVREFANANTRMHRICLLGPCASGRTLMSKQIARAYGVVHVDLDTLLRDYQQEKGQKVEEVPLVYLSDEELCNLVGKRLSEKDCIRKGWVLDGFPLTVGQAEFLRQSHWWPTRVIQLKVPHEVVAGRIATRRIDVETGLAEYRTPDSFSARQRLVQAPHDSSEEVQRRYNLYADKVDKVTAINKKVSSVVNADQNPPDVFIAIKDRIDRPTSTELAQDPDAAVAPL